MVELGDKLHRKMVAHGLVAVRSGADDVATLGSFLDDYPNRRIDVKPATKEVWRLAIRAFFGAVRDIATITEGNAEDFKLYLIAEKLASTMTQKRLQFARTFSKDALKRRFINLNPFAEVSATAVQSPDRQRFITCEETEELLAACRPTWRVIVALCRHGGSGVRAKYCRWYGRILTES